MEIYLLLYLISYRAQTIEKTPPRVPDPDDSEGIEDISTESTEKKKKKVNKYF